MLNQAATDKYELAKLLNISDEQMNHIQGVEAGHGLIKVGSSLVPFENKFPRNTKLYGLMSTRPGEGLDQLKEEAEGADKGNSDGQSDGSEPTSQLHSDPVPTVQEKPAKPVYTPESLSPEQRQLILGKIREKAKSKEEYNALVKKYLGE